MGKCRVVWLKSTPLAPDDYLPRAALIQEQLVQAKEALDSISPQHTVCCVNGLTIQSLNECFLTLEAEGYSIVTVFLSARANADMRMWGNSVFYDNDRTYFEATGASRRIWTADTYTDHTLPSDTVVICGETLDGAHNLEYEFAKIILM